MTFYCEVVAFISALYVNADSYSRHALHGTDHIGKLYTTHRCFMKGGLGSSIERSPFWGL